MRLKIRNRLLEIRPCRTVQEASSLQVVENHLLGGEQHIAVLALHQNSRHSATGCQKRGWHPYLVGHLCLPKLSHLLISAWHTPRSWAGAPGAVGNLARAKGITVIPAAGGSSRSEMAQFTVIIGNLARPKKGWCVTPSAGGPEVAHF